MPTQRFDLSGKTALITGAAGLLGYEHAAALLECDATVVLTDISEQQLAETKRKLVQPQAANPTALWESSPILRSQRFRRCLLPWDQLRHC